MRRTGGGRGPAGRGWSLTRVWIAAAAVALLVVLPSAWASRGVIGLDGGAAVDLGAPAPPVDRPARTAPAAPITSTTTSSPTTTSPPAPTTTATTVAPTVPLTVAPPTFPPPTSPPPTVRPFYVAVVGDSLIAQSINDVLAGLVQAGWGADIFGHAGQAIDAPSIQGAADAAGADPDVDVVVLATTSNDNVANAQRADEVGADVALAEYRDRLAARLAPLGGRCIVLVDVRDRANEVYRSSFSPATNAELRSFAATRPNVVLVAWSDLSRGHGDDWFLADGLHFSDSDGHHAATDDRPAGRAAYAAAIVDGVRRCP